MRRPQRTTGLLSPILLTALLALLASGCNAPSKHRDNVFAELNRRGISTDINGLKAATRSRQDDGAFLFADIGFFDTISDADLLEALIHAANTGNFGLAYELARLDNNAQLDPQKLQQSFDQSVRRSLPTLTAALLRHGARPGPDTLFQAAYTDDFQQTTLLLQYDIDFTQARNNEALRMSARLGNLQTLKALVQSGKAPDELINRALHFGALTEKGAVVRYLVDWGVPVNYPDNRGCTALHYLAQDGQVGDVRYLVEQGAEVNHPCRGQQTPLTWAHYGKNQPVIDYLLSVGGTQP